ncbi:SHOCT domain-containing protein [Clostridium sp.]|uniref:SHOCT domain-containing protein n=1 Tax=Clostridium sp. TaxID=1506 RepID=UPI0026168895|nr:SHOCT domain-containing protein [Clostridium sp.]
MRHGYHMGYGNGYGYNMGYGFWGSDILILILIIFAALVFMLLRNKKTENPFREELIDILKEKYAMGIISADEYIERKSIIENIKYSNLYITILLKRYALCEVSTKEFFSIKNEIESINIDNITKERLVKGELSYNEFKFRKGSEV